MFSGGPWLDSYCYASRAAHYLSTVGSKMYVRGESQTEVWLDFWIDSNRPVKHVPRKYHVILRGVASSIQTPQRQRLREWRSALRRRQIPFCHSLNSLGPRIGRV